jgi:hypothetical protein
MPDEIRSSFSMDSELEFSKELSLLESESSDESEGGLDWSSSVFLKSVESLFKSLNAD